MSLNGSLRLAAEAALPSPPSASAFSASVCVSFVVAITAPACVRAHAARQDKRKTNAASATRRQSRRHVFEARQEWLTDTCHRPAAGNYLPGAARETAVSAR